MPSWDEYFMGFAQHAASKSKDTTRVGAIIVGPKRDIRSTGYNGPPRGVLDSPERFVRPAKYLFIVHAEGNAIAHAARSERSTEGCTLYCTHTPCSSCARLIIQAGIIEVVVGGGETHMPSVEFHAAREMFEEAGIMVRDFFSP